MRAPTSTPIAEVVAVRRGYVDIACPYCGGVHTHKQPSLPAVAIEWRAPQCGLNLNARERGLGYCYTIPTHY